MNNILSTEVNLKDIQNLIGGEIAQLQTLPYKDGMVSAINIGKGYSYFFEIIKEVAALQRLIAFDVAVRKMDRIYHSAMQSIVDENWFTYRTNVKLRTWADFARLVLVPSLRIINESQEKQFYREITINLQIMHRSEDWFNQMKYQNPTTQRRNRLATQRVKRFTNVRYELMQYLVNSQQAKNDILSIYKEETLAAGEISKYRKMIIENSYLTKLANRKRLKMSDAEYSNVKEFLPNEVKQTSHIVREFESAIKGSIGMTGKNIESDLGKSEKTVAFLNGKSSQFNRRYISLLCAEEARKRIASVSSLAIMYFVLGVNSGELYSSLKSILDNSKEGGSFTVSLLYDNITNNLKSKGMTTRSDMGELVKGYAVNKVRVTLQEKYSKR